MKKPVIICVDDEPSVLDSLKIELKKALGNECLIETSEGGQEALELLAELREEEYEVALVLCDYIMPDIKGDALLKKMHEMVPNTLKIMLTGQADLQAVSNAIKYARLYRYIPKPWEAEDLKLTVVEAVHSYLQDKKLTEQNAKLQEMNQRLEELTTHQANLIADRTAKLEKAKAELEKANGELYRLANLDGLTQIANRRRFDEYLFQEWRQMAEKKQPLSLIFCDVDFFKRYNDEYGHALGDDCLRQLAQAMSRAVVRPTDLVARYGGEEFAVILPNTNTSAAARVAEAIAREVQCLKIVHAGSEASKYVTLSIGVASTVPTPPYAPDYLIALADMALYDVKKQGRARILLKTF